jgi:predicted dehydrogenase
MNLQYAIIGAGLIGKKRTAALAPGQVVAVCDVQRTRADELAKLAGNAKSTTFYAEAIAHPGVNAVIVATVNRALAEIALAAIRAGKHVLLEKPGAIHPSELQPLIQEAKAKKVCVRIGYNHRYHPAFQKAREIIDSGDAGPLMFIRGRYGHGGRVGYDKEWRTQPEISGGGELIDQGVHLIDLASWFLGEFTHVRGTLQTYFWKMPVEDNAFVELKTTLQQVAWLQSSCTEWKNMFSFEIYGRDAKLQIDGLGGSYGMEKLTYYKMKPEMGPPDATTHEYPAADTSWKLEMDEFQRDIETGRKPSPGLEEGLKTLEIVQTIYEQNAYPRQNL